MKKEIGNNSLENLSTFRAICFFIVDVTKIDCNKARNKNELQI